MNKGTTFLLTYCNVQRSQMGSQQLLRHCIRIRVSDDILRINYWFMELHELFTSLVHAR